MLTDSWGVRAVVGFTLVLFGSVHSGVAGGAGPAQAVPAASAAAPPHSLGTALSFLPGVRERSGSLLVRPFPVERHLANGMAPEEARARSVRARSRLDPFRTAVINEVDLHIVRPAPGQSEAALAEALRRTGDYQLVEPDWIVYPTRDQESDPELWRQWHLPRIAAPLAWNRTTGLPSVICAIIDTGIDLTHPDLQAALVPGYNAVNRLPQAAGGQVGDVNGHGTSVAGVAGAIGGNGVGGTGVGWDFRIMPVRVSNYPSGSASVSNIIAGIVWAVQNGARVVSVSYAGVEHPALGPTAGWVRAMGSMLVWSVDNMARDLGPADPPDIIVVSGTDESDGRYAGSSYGVGVDIGAPAVQIFTTALGGAYGTFNGCSYSAPIVAGTVGLIWSLNPGLSVQECEQVLFDSTDDAGAPGEDPFFGRGRVNAGRAVAMALDIEQGGTSGGPGWPLRPADPPRSTQPGLAAAYYRLEDCSALPPFSSLIPFRHQTVGSLNFAPTAGPFAGSGIEDHVGAVFDGYLTIPTGGLYTLYLSSSDGSALYLGQSLLIDNDGRHPMRERSAAVGLMAGEHRVRVEFFESDAIAGLVVSISGPGITRQIVPASMWRTLASTAR